jgi:hypothetical protein
MLSFDGAMISRQYPKQSAAFFNDCRYSWIEGSTKSGKTVSCMGWLSGCAGAVHADISVDLPPNFWGDCENVFFGFGTMCHNEARQTASGATTCL